MNSRAPVSRSPALETDKILATHKKQQQQQTRQWQPISCLTTTTTHLLKERSHSTLSFYQYLRKILIISASLMIIRREEFPFLNVRAQQLDLIELLRQQQQLQLDPTFSRGSSLPSFLAAPVGQTPQHKRLGMLECVAKLHGRFHELQTQLTSGTSSQPAQSQQQQPWPPVNDGSSSRTLFANHTRDDQQDHENLRPQIIVLPSEESNNLRGDDEQLLTQTHDEVEPGQVVEQGEDEVNSYNLDDQQAADEFNDQEADGQEADYEDQQEQLDGGGGDRNESSPATYYQDRRAASRRTWAGLGAALVSKLKPNMTGSKRRRSAASGRFKRQTSNIDGLQEDALTDSLAQLITNALLGARQRNQLVGGQLQAMTPTATTTQLDQTNPIQAALGTVVPIGQQLLNELFAQGARDIPVRMANAGQLLANLIVTLTVNNPMLVNSPLLARARPILRQTTTTSGSGAANGAQPVGIISVLTNVIRALNQSQPMGSGRQSLTGATPQTTSTTPPPPTLTDDTDTMSTFSPNSIEFEPTVSSLFTSDDSLLLATAASQRNERKLAATRANKTALSSWPARRVELRAKVGGGDDDPDTVAFVRRLNALTLGQANGTRAGVAHSRAQQKRVQKKKVVQQQQRRSRNKRSLGALMMFGPFSKFYMAMTLHRLMKYQSGVLSQAVMGELVRRYVIPGFSSALTGGVGGQQSSQQLINQARQLFMRSTTNPVAPIQTPGPGDLATGFGAMRAGNMTRPLPQSASVMAPLDLATNRPHLTQQELVLQQLRVLAPQQKTAEAECEFQHANGLDLLGRAVRFTTPLDMQQLYQLLQTSWGSYYSHAMSNPLVSLEPGRGLTISLPISQTSMTIPSLLAQSNGAHDASRRPLDHSVRTRPALHQLLPHKQRERKSRRRPKSYPIGDDFDTALDGSNGFDRPPGQQQTAALREFLKQASPEQLLEVLNKTLAGQTTPPFETNQDNHDDDRVRSRNAHKSKSISPASEQIEREQLKLLRALVGSLNKTSGGDNRDEASVGSVDGLAEKLLSKSLTSLMESLLKQEDKQHKSPMMLENQDQRQLSEQMMAEHFGSLNQQPEQGTAADVNESAPADNDSKNPIDRHKKLRNTLIPNDANPGIQLTLTADNATNLMDKLKALTSTNNKTAEHRSGPNLPENLDMPASEHRQGQHNNLARLDHHIVQPTTHLMSSSSHSALQQDQPQFATSHNASFIVGAHHLAPQTVHRSGQAALAKQRAVQHQQRRQQMFASVEKTEKSSSVDFIKVDRDNSSRTYDKTTGQHSFTNKNIAPVEPPAARDESISNHTRSASLANRPDERPTHAPDHHRVSIVTNETRPNDRLREGPSQQPLNNLAMALNVMNMVMLNRRLISTAPSSGNSSESRPSQEDPRRKPGATTTTITGNFTLNNSRILLPSAGGNRPKVRPIKLAGRGQSKVRGGSTSTRYKMTKGEMYGHSNATTTTTIGTSIASVMTTSAPDFVLINVTRPSGSRDENGKPSENIQSTNHRTSTNTIRLHQNLSLLDAMPPKPTTLTTSTPPRYYFQPLVAKGTPPNKVMSQSKTQDSIEPESDHADRWNDVLQHLDLSALPR